MYLQAHFHDESIVMVTSRSLKTLTYLGIDESNCFPMPKLRLMDAKKLLLYHAARGKQFSSHQDKQDIEECIALCCFSKDKKGGRHYLPLALKALGVQLGCVGNEPSLWVKTLPKVKDFNYLEEENNPVFSILRSSFDRLQAVDQNVFMDVVLFTPRLSPAVGLIQWLSLVYSQDLQEIQSRLRRLKERGLLEAVNMTSQTIRVHDLYREFAELEAEGKLNAKKFKKRMWVNYKDTFPAELEMTPSHTCWQNLTRLSIVAKSRSSWQDSRSLEGIEWRNCSNVVVLKLKKLDRLRGDLNLTALKCLKSLGLIDIYELDTLDGLQDLNNLNYISWVNYNKDNPSKVVHTRMGQLPSSLKVLQLFVEVWLGPDVISRCTDLRELDLARCEADNVDFSNCLSLQSIWLCSLPLRALWGLSATTVTLSSLHVSLCLDLVEIPDLGRLVGLQLLELIWNVKFKKLPDLEKLTSLQVLSIDRMEIGGLGCLRRLRELEFTYLPPSVLKLPNLSGFEKLQDVDFSYNRELRSLEGVFAGHLPVLRSLTLISCTSLIQLPDLSDLRNLQSLNLHDCSSLIRLPGLSGLRNLEDVCLCGSGIMLREEDIFILAALPLLRPVMVGTSKSLALTYKLRLDVVRLKVLKWVRSSGQDKYQSEYQSWLSWKKWVEKDLDCLPINAGNIDF